MMQLSGRVSRVLYCLVSCLVVQLGQTALHVLAERCSNVTPGLHRLPLLDQFLNVNALLDEERDPVTFTDEDMRHILEIQDAVRSFKFQIVRQ
jgi:hypothetical protein